MTRSIRTLGLALAIAGTAGCASTTIKDSWSDPKLAPSSLKFEKILAIAMMPDQTRRVAEDEMVRQLGPRATASYKFLSEEDLKNKEAAKTKVKEAGYDGAVIMRLTGKEQRLSYVPGSYPAPYYSFYGYYGYAGAAVYDPGYMTTDTIVSIETNVYSVTEDKLLWSGLSETFNPANTVQLVTDVAKAVRGALQKQGLIQAKAQ